MLRTIVYSGFQVGHCDRKEAGDKCGQYVLFVGTGLGVVYVHPITAIEFHKLSTNKMTRDLPALLHELGFMVVTVDHEKQHRRRPAAEPIAALRASRSQP
jgi:hypothetical protein